MPAGQRGSADRYLRHEAAARKVVGLAPKLARSGIRIKGVRIDSGNLAEHARKVRKILDGGGLDYRQASLPARPG